LQWMRSTKRKNPNKRWLQRAASTVTHRQWIWDEEKEAANKRKHGIDFEIAAHVLNDPLSASRPDPYLYEERCDTIGAICGVTIFVAHTMPQLDIRTGEAMGRIISARKATTHERRAYEEGNF
jgi:Uncharacterized protein conserved in bacteria